MNLHITKVQPPFMRGGERHYCEGKRITFDRFTELTKNLEPYFIENTTNRDKDTIQRFHYCIKVE